MPRHLISDAHEWINEIPSPYLLSSETTDKGTGLAKSAGKEDPVELPYSYSFFTYSIERRRASQLIFSNKGPIGGSIRVEDTVRFGVWLGRHICQMIRQVS